VQSKLDHLLTYTAGNGVMVQIPIKAIKGICIELINVSLRFVRLTVLIVKKQFVLDILTESFCGFC
jgi:hypothetical protein